jgi:catechol 2,3-dioxygenase
MLKQVKTARKTDRLSWGMVEFQVTNLARTVDFWTQSFGITVRHQDSEMAALGTQDKTLVVFRSGATRTVEAAHLGMYHIAIGVPDQAEFSRVLARLITRGVHVSPTDHLASKSIYFSDPDGLALEIILETPERFGRYGDLNKGLIMYDVHGAPHSGRAPLDVQAELEHAADADLDAPLSQDSFVAHLHFKVNNLDAASTWFERIGFTKGLMIPKFGFADMSAGGQSSHRLAMNVWAGPNLSPPPSDMARMTRYAVHVHDPELIASAKGPKPTKVAVIGTDPAGIEITLIPTC